MTVAVVVMLTIVISFLVVAALIGRAEEQATDEDADTRVWRRLINRYDEENQT